MQNDTGLLFVVLLVGLLLIAGPCKQTTPDNPPPPPATGLAARVRTLVLQHVPASNRGPSATLAGEYRRLAAEIQAAVEPLSESTLTSPAAAIAASNAAARATLGTHWPAWTKFYSALYAELNAAAQQPDADRTVYGVGRTFAQIAEGLAGV